MLLPKKFKYELLFYNKNKYEKGDSKVKKEFILALIVLSILLISGCDVYTTLYVKPADGDAVEVPCSEIMVEDSDILVEDDNEVFRVESTNAEENLEKTLYASTEETKHDPFKVGENPLGPFERGESLGFTLGEWLEADGKGIYTEEDGAAELDLTFENLVPDSIYTIWCSRISFPPTLHMVDFQYGAEDGSENIFGTESEGSGEYNLELDPLEPSTEETATIIALAYHSDGNTYDESAGEFGFNSHVQIFYLMPVPEEDDLSNIKIKMDFVNHIEAGFPEQDVFIMLDEAKEDDFELIEILEELEIEEDVDEIIEEIEVEFKDGEDEIAEDATVIIVEETDFVRLVTNAEDPDEDALVFTYTTPLDDKGEWSTTYGDSGEYTVTLTASDGELTASKEVLIIVNRKEEAPTFDSLRTSETAIEIGETEAITFSVVASDLNEDILSYLWKLDGENIGNEETVQYESTYEDSGSHTIKVTVSDGIFDTEKIWSVTVNNLNRKPELEAIDDIVLEETDTVVIKLDAYDDDGDVLTYGIDDERFI